MTIVTPPGGDAIPELVWKLVCVAAEAMVATIAVRAANDMWDSEGPS